MKLAVTLLLALVAVVVPAGAPAAAGAGREWATSDATPIGRPVAVGAVVVGLVVRARHVYARGIAPDTGKVLWEHEVSPSAQPASVEMTPVRVGAYAVLLQPEPAFGPDHARVSVVEPRTGEEVHRSPAMLVSSRPEACFGGRSVCVLAAPGAEDPAQGYRLNLDSGALLPYPPSGRSLGPSGLIASGRPGSEQIGLVGDGVLRWRHPFAEVLPRVASSAGSRWAWHPGEAVYTGSAFARGDTPAGLDLGRDATVVALDAGDGRVLWRRGGASVDCGGRIGLAGFAVRCRYRGVVAAKNGSTRHTGLGVVLEGFDPRGGAARWSVPVGVARPAVVSRPAVPTSDLSARSATPVSPSVVRLAVGDGRLAIADPNTVVIDGAAGPVLVDLRDGSVAAPLPGAVFWCPKRTRFAYREDGGARSGGDVYTTCDAEGKPVTGVPSPAAVGAAAGGFVVVAGPGGYRGFPSVG